MDSEDMKAAGVSEQPDTQGEPMALTTDEAASAPTVRANGERSASGSISRATDNRGPLVEEAPYPPTYPPNTGRNPPPVPPPLAAGRRITSPGGGVQVTLDGKGSWSELARQDATLPTDANCVDGSKQESSGGMFGFLRGKKGRSHSPKPKERGVLGKEGARVVIG